MTSCRTPSILLATLLLAQAAAAEPSLPERIRFEPGPLNAIELTAGDRRLAINRSIDPEPDMVLLTHARRDIVRAARETAPLLHAASIRTQLYLEEAEAHWVDWWDDRFDYYGQQVRKWPTRNWPAHRYFELSEEARVAEFSWEDLDFRVLDTPGYTRDGTTYLVDIDGEKVAFVGDLLLSGGQVRDLYSFQNEIPDAKVGAYHGYLGRLAQWIESVKRLAAEKPTLLVPSRGPISATPLEDIDQAVSQSRKIYRNYLETNALHWYFGEERMGTCAERVLGADHGVQGMPLAEYVDLPEWCRHIGTTKLLISMREASFGSAFALDVGGARSLETLMKLQEENLIPGLEGIFATHTHNDHTAAIADAAREFDAPVLAVREVGEVLLDPGAWFLPGVSPNRVETVEILPELHSWNWHEFRFTARFFPGQMFNHGALLVEKDDHDPVFFIGDSFSPSGIDDYCLMNRNLMRDDTGYLYCLGIVRSLPEGTWLVNQHIPHLFRFTEDELDFLEGRYRQRRDWIAGFTPWDDPNFAIDEQWARFFPYARTLEGQEDFETRIVIENHSTEARSYRVSVRQHDRLLGEGTVEIAARDSGTIELNLSASALEGEIAVLTADIERDDGRVETAFCETLIRVSGPE